MVTLFYDNLKTELKVFLRSGKILVFIHIYVGCTCTGGIMSGLTVGLLSIDMLDLEIKIAIGTQAEMKQVSIFLLNLLEKRQKI